MGKVLKAPNSWQITGISLSVAWSLLLGTVFNKLPIVQKLELSIQDSLLRLYKPNNLPNDILIVTIDKAITKPEHTFYTNLVKHLIAQEAKVVVINLPYSLKRPLDNRLEDPFKALIDKYPHQIVLVTNTKKRSQQVPLALPIYYHLLPFDDKRIKPKVAPEQVHGFFEYETDLIDLTSPARQAHLAGHFVYVEDFHQTHELKSVAVLALDKFFTPLPNRALTTIIENEQIPLTQTAIGINFWGPAGTFPQLDISSICNPTAQLHQCRVPSTTLEAKKIRNKLVLVDLPRKNFAGFGVISPFGDRISVGELQANLIASLMTHSFLKNTPEWFDYTVNTLGAVLINLLITAQIVKNRFRSIRPKIWLFLGIVGGYIGISLLFSWQGLIMPLAMPILTWIGAVTGVAVCLLLWQKQQQLHQQRQALAERQAVLFQARKLLHRVATDIHDGPLQELKLVMDGVELLAINHPTVNPNPLLDRLEAVGRDLRAQLCNTRTMAEKLEITPELEAGLEQGIRQHLQQLVGLKELSLRVEDNLQPLNEPESDSSWIDAREDIFRFYKEAIANVVRHAQPPNGTATRVTVSLFQKETQCTLIVENDAIKPELATLESTSRRKHSGGYGTKVMATVAAELPGGYWERVPLADGGMQVILSWTMDATAQNKTEDY